MEAVYIADLAPFQEQYKSTFGHVTAGFQDIAEDSNGNSYAPASFSGYSIAKIAPNGMVTPFFMSNETTKYATASPYLYFGLVFLPSQINLLIIDGRRGAFVTFDTKSHSPVPTPITISNLPSNYTSVLYDANVTPDRYPHQRIVFCAEDYLGGSGAITAFSSKDNWASAKYLDVVYNTDPRTKGFLTRTAVKIANSIYLSSISLSDGLSYDTVGNGSSFPMVDIAELVDTLMGARYPRPSRAQDIVVNS
ncbi:hypothetical protein H4I96_03368 [Botrytis cinerea]